MESIPEFPIEKYFPQTVQEEPESKPKVAMLKQLLPASMPLVQSGYSLKPDMKWGWKPDIEP